MSLCPGWHTTVTTTHDFTECLRFRIFITFIFWIVWNKNSRHKVMFHTNRSSYTCIIQSFCYLSPAITICGLELASKLFAADFFTTCLLRDWKRGAVKLCNISVSKQNITTNVRPSCYAMSRTQLFLNIYFQPAATCKKKQKSCICPGKKIYIFGTVPNKYSVRVPSVNMPLHSKSRYNPPCGCISVWKRAVFSKFQRNGLTTITCGNLYVSLGELH